MKSLKELIQKLKTIELKEIKKRVDYIYETIEEIIDILNESISAVSIRFKYEDLVVNTIEIYGHFSGAFYTEVQGTQISTGELRNILKSEQMLIAMVRVLTSAVEELVKVLKDIVEDELDIREPPDP